MPRKPRILCSSGIGLGQWKYEGVRENRQHTKEKVTDERRDKAIKRG